jgi:GTPase
MGILSRMSIEFESSTVGTRAGFVALVGRPNVGKSTLMNALVGEKLSIVTPRAQTTREPVTGILTDGTDQVVFVDTPGLLEPRYALQRSMQEQALEALEGADLALLLLDAARPDEVPAGEALAALAGRGTRLLVVTNKVDAAADGALLQLAEWSRRTFGAAPYEISALHSEGLDALRAALLASLPASPFFYPEDEIAVQSVRFFVSELVRETIFEEYEQEVPYSAVVRVEEYREGSEPLFIRATVYVERESQKAIIVGSQGAAIRRLGERSREKIETFVGQPVYLDLWVKALPGWRKKSSALQYLGYRAPKAGVPEDGDPFEIPVDDHAGRGPGSGAGPDRGGRGGAGPGGQRSAGKRKSRRGGGATSSAGEGAGTNRQGAGKGGAGKPRPGKQGGRGAGAGKGNAESRTDRKPGDGRPARAAQRGRRDDGRNSPDTSSDE